MAKDVDKEVEERPVEKAELTAGVKLNAGHPVVLLVGGVPGGGSGEADPSGADPADPSGADDPSGEGSGEGGEDPSSGPSTPSDPAEPATPTGPSGPTPPSSGADATGGTDATSGGEPDEPQGTGGADDPGAATGAEEPAKPPEDAVTPSLRAVFDAAHFETDKTFPLKEALPTFRAIAQLAVKEPHRAALVLGHTDSVGKLDHNQRLSLERAQAVAGYLKNDVAAWMKYYKGTPGSTKWGVREDQHMLAALPWGGPAWYGGPINGDPGGATREAVRKLQQAKGLPASGTLDDKSRQALVAEFMAADGTTAPAAMDLEALGVADWHRLEDTTKASAKNRRVEVFLFEKQGFQPAASDCKGHGKSGDKGACKAYDAWVKQAGAIPAAPAARPPAPAPKPPAPDAPAPAQKVGDLLIRLHLDPAAAATRDDRFTLSSSDGKVKQVKTVKDDAKKGDQCIDLLFTKLPTGQKFTLEVDLGKEGGPHQVFKDVSYAELAGLSAKAKPGPTGDGVAALAAKIHDPPDAAGKKGREATLWNVPPK